MIRAKVWEPQNEHFHVSMGHISFCCFSHKRKASFSFDFWSRLIFLEFLIIWLTLPWLWKKQVHSNAFPLRAWCFLEHQIFDLCVFGSTIDLILQKHIEMGHFLYKFHFLQINIMFFISCRRQNTLKLLRYLEPSNYLIIVTTLWFSQNNALRRNSLALLCSMRIAV